VCNALLLINRELQTAIIKDKNNYNIKREERVLKDIKVQVDASS